MAQPPAGDPATAPAQPAYDAIVVGAGPGGSATATHLARRGLSVLLLEKAHFPRDKVCGDGLTPRAVRALTRLGVDTTGWHPNTGLRVHGGTAKDLYLPWPDLADFPNHGFARARADLDEALARHAAASGATLIEGANVTAPVLDGDRIVGVTLKDGRIFRAPVVVAADGVSSRLGIAMGVQKLDERPMGVAVRAYYRTDHFGDADAMESWLELWDGEPGRSNVLPGYGWVFPLGNGVANVGLGMLSTSDAFGTTDYKDLMRRWLAATPPEWGLSDEHRIGEIRGAALPMCLSRTPLYARGLLLVGDAGGMVNPFNGEGIDYALEAAERAADAIAEARSRGVGTPAAERALEGYAAHIKADFGGYYRLGSIFARLIGHPQVMRACVRYGLPRKALMRFVHKLLANLTDARGGDASDRIINTLTRIAPPA